MKKRILICLDGTWNEPEEKSDGGVTPTNVLKLVRTVKPIDSEIVHQVVFYDQGVGTGGPVDKFLGGSTGLGISQNILDAYRFLAHNYNDGDEIFCFGFSRGAYTIRSFGGLIASVGIMPKRHLEHLPLLFKYYRTHPKKRGKIKNYDKVQELKQDAIKSPIKFMGVWETVGALGAPTPFLGWITKKIWVGFHDTELRNIQYAYHALAIDERRGPFAPSVWTDKGDDVEEVKQVWFSGAHSNIGGGYSDACLSDIAFRWIVKMAALRDLEFDADALTQVVHTDYPNWKKDPVNSYTTGYRVLEKLNVPMYLRPLGKKHRDVGEENVAVKEMIHQSAVDRFNNYKNGRLSYNLENFEHGVNSLPVEPY
jgi:uncharacterized protein (DUF2235 family)